MLGIQLIRNACDLPNQWRTRLPVTGKLAGSEKYSGSSVAQQVKIVHFFATQVRHGNGIRLRRCGLAVSQQFAGVLARLSRAAEILAKASCLQLHLRTALVALQRGPIVAL